MGRVVTLVRKYAGKKHFIGVPLELYNRAQAFADKGGYTLASVIETALEDFLEVDPLAGDLGDTDETPASTNGSNGHHPKDRIVVVKIEGGARRLAQVVDENPKPGFKTVRLQDGRSVSRFSTKTHRLLDAEIIREATLEERLKGLSS